MKPTKHAKQKLTRFSIYLKERRVFAEIQRETFSTYLLTSEAEYLLKSHRETFAKYLASFEIEAFLKLTRTFKHRFKELKSFNRGLCGRALKPVEKNSLRLRNQYFRGVRAAEADSTNGAADWAYFNPYTEEIEK